MIWSDWAFYIAVPTSIICLIFLPIAYISVVILHNRRSFLGAALPCGGRRWLWNLAFASSLTIVLVAVGRVLYLKTPAVIHLRGLSG